jgi:catechol 2,3-dioxygenase-like lactoylglutathione lyase family enzyme
MAKQHLRGGLHFVELGTPDPSRLAEFYEAAMGMARSSDGEAIVCCGPERRLVLAPGDGGQLLAAGYRLTDEAALQALSDRLSEADCAYTAVETRFFEPGAIALSDPDGNRLVFGMAPDEADGARTGLVGRMQHVVVGSQDAGRLAQFYRDVLGFRESDRVLDDQGKLRTCFLRSDDEHHSFAVFQTSQVRLDHICYEAGAWSLIRDWGDHFAGQRIPIKWGPGRHGPGNNLFLFVTDPDGNWVEISAELEHVDEDRPTGVWPHAERTLNTWGQAFLRS